MVDTPISPQEASRRHGRETAECDTVAVIPAYNEERFIGSVVLRARKYADVVIVVDDGSTDATAELILPCHFFRHAA